MNNTKKNILYVGISIVIYYFLFIKILPRALTNATNIYAGEKYVILIGDFQNKDSFGKQVLSGFEIAYNKDKRTSPLFKYITVNVDESLVENVAGTIEIETRILKNKIEKDLIKQISTKNVIAIIAANTSQTIEPVLNVGKTFNIPVLLTVSTKKSFNKDYSGIYFRLLAGNNKQAKIIIKWVKNYLDNPNSSIGVLYSPTKYGYDLLNSLRKNLDTNGYSKIIPFSISTTTDIVGSIKYGKSLGVSSWVSLSYLSESIEIYAKKTRIDTINPILFSDGAYGTWLESIKNDDDKIYLSFPETYLNKNKIDNVSGFGIFGYDAFYIINYCISTNKSENGVPKLNFLNKVSEFDNTSFKNRETIQKYRFESGENINSNFKIYSIKNDLP